MHLDGFAPVVLLLLVHDSAVVQEVQKHCGWFCAENPQPVEAIQLARDPAWPASAQLTVLEAPAVEMVAGVANSLWLWG